MLIAMRTVTIRGRTYRKDDPVDPELLAPEKAAQLVARRVLRAPAVTLAPNGYVACRAFTVGRRTFVRGARVSPALLSPGKLSQLLEHRWIEPALPAVPTDFPAVPEPSSRRRARAA